MFFVLGIVTVQYCEDETGLIKLFARPIGDERSSDEVDTSSNNDSENILRKSVQFVSREIGYLVVKYL